MDDVVDALRAQREELVGLVADLDDEGLALPSRCPGWSVADVLLHLAQTDEMAVASVTGDIDGLVALITTDTPATGDVDAWADALVAVQREGFGAMRDRWLAASHAQVDAFASADPHTRVRWVAGDMAARTLATTRLTETWIHTVDVGAAVGSEPAPTDRLWHTARLVWRTVPYALAQEGLTAQGDVAFVLASPGGGEWTFGDPSAPTVIRGAAVDLCTVAGQRGDAATMGVEGSGPDAGAVLRFMRTFA